MNVGRWRKGARRRLISAVQSMTPPSAAAISAVPSATIAAEGYFSQVGQDLLLDRHIFVGRQSGVFVDVGAHDGITMSNTYFFESQRGWTGVCVEPNPEVFALLSERRSARCFNVAVGANPGTSRFRLISGAADMLSGLETTHDSRHRRRVTRDIAERGGSSRSVEVAVRRLDDVLREADVTRIDLLSVDVEGGEIGVLQSIDLQQFEVQVAVIENNFGSHAIPRQMSRQGYQLLLRLAWDEIYIPRNARPSTKR